MRTTKEIIFEETFVSPFQKDSESDAFKVLEAIRESHPASSGWEEVFGYVESLANGKYRAVRKHRKYAS